LWQARVPAPPCKSACGTISAEGACAFKAKGKIFASFADFAVKIEFSFYQTRVFISLVIFSVFWVSVVMVRVLRLGI